MKTGQMEVATARLQQTLPGLARYFRVDCISISYFDGWTNGSMWLLPVFGFRDEKLQVFLDEHNFDLPTQFWPPFQTSEIVWGRGAWPNGYLQNDEPEVDESNTQFLSLVREKASYPVVLPKSDGSFEVVICCLMEVDKQKLRGWNEANAKEDDVQEQIEPIDLCRLIAAWGATQLSCSNLAENGFVLASLACAAVQQFRANWREEIRNSLFGFFGKVVRELEPSCSLSVLRVKADGKHESLEKIGESDEVMAISELSQDFFDAFTPRSFTRSSQSWRALATPVASQDGLAHWIYPFINGEDRAVIRVAMGEGWSREENAIPARILITLLLESYFDVLRCSPLVSGLSLRAPMESARLDAILSLGRR